MLACSGLSFAHFRWCFTIMIPFLAFYVFSVAALCHILQVFFPVSSSAFYLLTVFF